MDELGDIKGVGGSKLSRYGAAVLARPGYVKEILHEGSKKARLVAEQTIERVRAAVKLRYV